MRLEDFIWEDNVFVFFSFGFFILSGCESENLNPESMKKNYKYPQSQWKTKNGRARGGGSWGGGRENGRGG